MTRMWRVLLVAAAATGCSQLQPMAVDGGDPSVGYLRAEVDKMQEKVAEQVDADTRLALQLKQLAGEVGTNSERIARVDERVSSMLADVGEVRARMELLEGSTTLSDRTLDYLQTPLEFDFDKDELQKAGRLRIEVVADFLESDHDVQVAVVGYLPPGCPTIDAPECGENPLVQRRVKIVLGRLERSGISGDRVAEEYLEPPSSEQKDEIYLSLRTAGGSLRPPPTPEPDATSGAGQPAKAGSKEPPAPRSASPAPPHPAD
jgi:outer membrane protein OmpA-like peptidoglycan-associated protein